MVKLTKTVVGGPDAPEHSTEWHGVVECEIEMRDLLSSLNLSFGATWITLATTGEHSWSVWFFATGIAAGLAAASTIIGAVVRSLRE